jgi:hypothetical protein
VGRLIVHGISAAGITAILLLQAANRAEPEKAYERERERTAEPTTKAIKN